jgi:hypothetical protein
MELHYEPFQEGIVTPLCYCSSYSTSTVALQCFYIAFCRRNLVQVSFKFKFELFLNYSYFSLICHL